MWSGHIYSLEISETGTKTKSRRQIFGKTVVTEDIRMEVQESVKKKEAAKFFKFIKYSEYSIVEQLK